MKKTKSPTPVTDTLQKQYDLLTSPDKKSASRKIIITASGEIHVFPSANSPVPAEIVPDRVFESLDKFLELNRQTRLAYHETFFKECAPPKQDLMATSLYCWAHMLRGTPHIESPGRDPITGKKERKSSIKTRTYFPGESTKLPDKCPAQMATCMRIFSEALKSGKITEAELEAEITRRAPELATRQDPWRIFQYYRPRLITLKLLRHD